MTKQPLYPHVSGSRKPSYLREFDVDNFLRGEIGRLEPTLTGIVDWDSSLYDAAQSKGYNPDQAMDAIFKNIPG